MKSGEFATEAPSEGLFEVAAAGSPEAGTGDALWEADEEAILLVILWSGSAYWSGRVLNVGV